MNTYEKQIINEFFADIREFKKKVLEKTNNTYKISFIKYIKDNTGNNIDTKRFTLKKSFYAKNLDKVIFNNKIYYKNRNKFENIYISLSTENEKTNLLWLDDIKLENFTNEQLKYMTLIETSENNYQAFIILDKELTKDELKQVKKYFCKNYNTDLGSIDFTHLMRLPYFYSYKHEQPHYITVKQYQEELLPIQPILNKIEKKISETDNRIQHKQIKNKINNIDINILKQIYNKYFEIKIKEFEEKQRELKEQGIKSEVRQDYNIIDFRFIHYLHYFTNINIYNIDFESILYDIENRKKGHIDDYINRTINKVVHIDEYYEEYINYDEYTLKNLFQNNKVVKKQETN